MKPAGQEHFAFVDGLDPYTLYEIRLQACQNGKSFFLKTHLHDWKEMEICQIDSTHENR